jgi:hypothetical protein
VYTTPDDPVVDTAETIVTLEKLDVDPKSWKSSAGNTPVDYMLKNALNSDGSFDSMKNTLDAAEALTIRSYGGTARITNPAVRPGEACRASARRPRRPLLFLRI